MSDLLCPWCGGELPGEPGQFVKCRHCSSDIYWGDSKPWRTKMQAANASRLSESFQPVPVDEKIFTAAPSSKPDFVPEDVDPPPVPLVEMKSSGTENATVGRFETRRQKKRKREAEARKRFERAKQVGGDISFSDFCDLPILFGLSYRTWVYISLTMVVILAAVILINEFF